MSSPDTAPFRRGLLLIGITAVIAVLPMIATATAAAAAGQVTARNVSYNATLAPGASTDLGFQASHTGNAAAPPVFTLNGMPCTLM